MWIRSLMLLTALTLGAHAQETETAAPPPMGDMLSSWLMMMVMIFAVFYFLLIRPQQKQKREIEEKLNALSKGDRVITAGGIYGTIIGVKENIAVLKIAENVKIEVLKSAITQVLGKDEKGG